MVYRIEAKLRDFPWITVYGVEPEQTLIYFDHKLADAVSVPSKMFGILYVVNAAGEEVAAFHPIQGCEEAEYQTNRGEKLTPETRVFDYNAEKTCPIAFYKGLRYTFRGKELTGNGNVFSAISRLLKVDRDLEN